MKKCLCFLALVVAVLAASILFAADGMPYPRIDNDDLSQIIQQNDRRCGPLSLLAVCELLGVEASLDELYELSNWDEKTGTTMYDLYQAARLKGLNAVGLKMDLESLAALKNPAIAFVKGGHFLVVEKFLGNDLRVILPPKKPYLISKDEFAEIYSRKVLVISKGRDAYLDSLGLYESAQEQETSAVVESKEWEDKVSLGERSYRKNCASCHGVSGIGWGTTSPLLGITDRLSKGRIMEVIKRGILPTMPPFDNLKLEELEDIYLYLSTLEPKESPKPGGEVSKAKATEIVPNLAQEIIDELRCPCGCGMNVADCTCKTAVELRGYTRAKVEEGYDKAAVKGMMVDKYGDQVLSIAEVKETLSPEPFFHVAEAYQIAKDIPRIVEQVPCFCHCERMGHRSLLDCFKDRHGADCKLCIDEAIKVSQLHQEGLKVDEIRTMIISQFGGMTEEGSEHTSDAD